jgi:TolB protein
VNASGGDLYVTSSRGGPATKLVDSAFYPAWSPDGRWIVFQSSRGGRWDLWKIAANGGAPVQITNDPQFDYQPCWSPDGKQIVYASGMPEPYRVKLVDANGKRPRELTDGEDRILLKPVFTADGESIVYSSMRGGSLNLWRLRLSSKKPQRLTLGEGDDVHPTIRGDRIAYAAVRQTPDLWSLNLTGDVATAKAEQVTFDTGIEEFPHRSRDGAVVFASDRGGTRALWLRDASGTLTQFAAGADAGQPHWSPTAGGAYRFRDLHQ